MDPQVEIKLLKQKIASLENEKIELKIHLEQEETKNKELTLIV